MKWLKMNMLVIKKIHYGESKYRGKLLFMSMNIFHHSTLLSGVLRNKWFNDIMTLTALWSQSTISDCQNPTFGPW